MAKYPIELLDVENIDDVEDWHERFKLNVATNDKIDGSNKTAHYVTATGKKAYRLLKASHFPGPFRIWMWLNSRCC